MSQRENETERMETLQRQYYALLEGYHRQERTMKEVAAALRTDPLGAPYGLGDLADALDPQEPVHPDDR